MSQEENRLPPALDKMTPGERKALAQTLAAAALHKAEQDTIPEMLAPRELVLTDAQVETLAQAVANVLVKSIRRGEKVKPSE